MSENPHGTFTLSEPLDLEDPLDASDARKAAQMAARNRRKLEQRLGEVVEQAAKAEDNYDETRAKAILRLRSSGEPATLCKELAKGETEVIEARHELDVANELVDIIKGKLRGCEGERAMLRQLVEMSTQLRVEKSRLAA